MIPPRSYASAAPFRVALETRLKSLALEQGIDLQRLRRQLAFDRLLCRLFSAPDVPWLLKGGYAMELRFKTARTTRDIDLGMRRLPLVADWSAYFSEVEESLREAAALDLYDFFVFVLGAPTQDLDAAPYGGARFPVDARLAGRSFAKFHLDVSTGDVMREPYETLAGHDWLAFAGIANGTFPAVSPEEQFAEKLHAYTLPRPDRENSRVKDLVDLVLLIERAQLDKVRLANSIRETFGRRKTHDIPAVLMSPPVSWSVPFSELASECRLDSNIDQRFALVDQFFTELKL